MHVPPPNVMSFRVHLLHFGMSLGSFSTRSARMIAEPELDKIQPNMQSLYHPFQEGTLRNNPEGRTQGNLVARLRPFTLKKVPVSGHMTVHTLPHCLTNARERSGREVRRPSG